MVEFATGRRWRRRFRPSGLAMVAAGLLALSTASPATQAELAATTHSLAAGEYQIKAVFLYNFTKYVEWPSSAFADAQAPFVIGVLGDDPFGSVLEQAVRDEKVNGHPLVVRHFSSQDEVKGCQILYISQSEDAHLDQILAALKGRSMLTVGDADKFTDHGGMIWLMTENNKIRLKINLDAAKAASLTISSNLLRAAEVTGHAKS